MEEKENIYGEQPQTDTLIAAASFESEGLSNEGSPFGKFKDANSLLNAYNSLQSEFTKKCQKLSELEKQNSNDNVLNETPCYLKEDWHSTLAEFLKSHKSAKMFTKQIAEEISKDKELALSQNPLQVAYARVLDKHYKSDDELFNDNNFLDGYLTKNPQLVNQILKKYLGELPKAPNLISSSKASATSLSPAVKAKDLTEARDLVQLLFK